MSVLEFIEANRRQGSTTELLRAALLVDGYFVVRNHQMKGDLLDRYPMLRVVTVYELRAGNMRGCQPRPVFIDASAMTCVGE